VIRPISTGAPACVRLCAAVLALTLSAGAQSLDRAEALWKARNYQEANDEFRLLVQKSPKNPDYRVRWGRLFLDRGQSDDAMGLFNEALEIRQDHPGALVGLALIAADLYQGAAGELASKALAADPKMVEAQELLARMALEDNDNSEAQTEARKALAINSNSVQGRAILAVMDWLADKKDSAWDPHDARGYQTAGHFFMINRRYEDAIQYFRKAIDLDPGLDSARSQLGINLMRLGRNEEAYRQLETCFNNGFRDNATKNSLKLMDSYKNFVTFQTDRTVLKLNRKEAELLHPYFESEMRRAIATYEKKYQFKLTQPVQVEAYPDHEDFAVRALGMPGLGALGVTFGYGIVMDSPSGRPPGSFHWAGTLWHEMSHVFTLNMTNFRVPRWFTEGLAVHEETAASPEWGDPITPDVLMAIKNKQLLPVAELDRGFIHPKREIQVVVSYFQAGKICDYINDKFGWNTLLAMLHDFGQNEDTPTVIRKELKMEPAEFDKQFIASVEASTKSMVDGFEEWRKRFKQVSELASKKDWDAVIKEGTAIRDLYPDYVEAGSVYEFLAEAHKAKGNKAAADGELERYVHKGGRNPETLKSLAADLAAAGRKKEAAEVLDRLNLIYPPDPELHQRLGDLWLEEGNATGAVREFRALVARGPLDPAQAHYDLARAYRLNHQVDQARDELLASLEAAPGFRPAQKLLLELSTESEELPHDSVKK
jgi:cellulose synthase operon protein C